jgi:uncharacterized Zn finger protein (UPF0148 family)
MKYTVKKGLLGKHTVHFACPHCQSDLGSPLVEAGQKTECPLCHKSFVTPGTTELQKRRDLELRDKRRQEAEQLREVESIAAERLVADQQQQQVEQQRQKAVQERIRHPVDAESSADRFLAMAFRFGKGVSVVVVALCFATIAISLLMLFGVRADAPRQNVVVFAAPTLAEYLESIKPPPTAEEASRRASAPDRRPEERQSDTLTDRYVALLSQFGLDSVDRRLEFMRLTGGDQRALVEGLQRFIADGRQGGGTVQATAVAWYISVYKSRWQASETAKEQARRQRAAAEADASAKRWQLLTVIGAAVAALMAFLFLPLLIQIEHNTRRVQEHLRHLPPQSQGQGDGPPNRFWP